MKRPLGEVLDTLQRGRMLDATEDALPVAMVRMLRRRARQRGDVIAFARRERGRLVWWFEATVARTATYQGGGIWR